MRYRLKESRESKGMTQQQVADYLGMSWRNYQRIEVGKSLGSIATWDALEDLFGINQRELRGQDERR